MQLFFRLFNRNSIHHPEHPQRDAVPVAGFDVDKGNPKSALKRIDEALEWPENLGVGKPYDDLIDTSSEDLLRAVAYSRLGDSVRAQESLAKVCDPDGSKAEFFRTATTKSGGKFPKLLSMLGNMDSSLDKKLF